MSLLRTVYLGAVLCGWMALGGWVAAEILRQGVSQPAAAAGPGEAAESAARFFGSESLGRVLASEKNQTIAAFCLVGAAIGAGLGLASGLSNWQLQSQILRMLRGLVAGGIGGILGGWVGAWIYQTFSSPGDAGGAAPAWLRPVGWMAAGALVGLADGVFALSANRMRNGLIGGLAGGLIGGILFDPIKALVAHTAAAGDPALQFEITSRAAGFVAVGLCIGGAVGLTHFILKHAWLTVLDGDRPGRQVILTGSGLTLGSDPAAGLPFLREADRSLLPTHLRIVRGRDGSFTLQAAAPAADADVTVMKQGVRQIRSLHDQAGGGIGLENDCVITCGRNSIRFNVKSQRGAAAASSAPAGAAAPPRPAPVLPPPVDKPAVPTHAQQMPPAPAAPHAVDQPRPMPPPLKTPEPAPAPAAHAPISRKVETGAAPPPAPVAAPHPPAGPVTAPHPVAAPAAPQPPPLQPQTVAQAGNTCPNGHKVPSGQRYCMLCDTYF